ncbi:MULTISPECIES: sirohydrochlorin chelatase [unclassified Duganella]|uniref:sirohydrochlorin chelatase n=1 Tax=unclassified Duganella TaxID=2636909 RepID=UPI0006FCBC41|nr:MULTISPECIES: CbiX/SirB N-terminal domain-containing protein [unclassified Duganella]KQV45558.1 cobalamin biosynthesis protein CbiX [Duganella sp. Root336D2]KRC00820.1 cobalamin biosynthesis protein CbiX [Duganella sp. Root198D2]
MGGRALVLFAHGARSASWAAPFEQLRNMVAARAPDADVSLAFLELMSPRLPEQVAALAAQGIDDVTVVPVFLGQGGHVLRDLPLLLDEMRLAHPGVAIRAVGAVGEDPTVLRAMTDYCLSSLPLA